MLFAVLVRDVAFALRLLRLWLLLFTTTMGTLETCVLVIVDVFGGHAPHLLSEYKIHQTI